MQEKKICAQREEIMRLFLLEYNFNYPHPCVFDYLSMAVAGGINHALYLVLIWGGGIETWNKIDHFSIDSS